MKVLNPFLKIFTWTFRLTYLAVGLAIIFAVFYLFAFPYLQGPLMGNDVANAFIYIRWLDRFWPNIPLWWPQQGGGGSFVYGHQIGSYFIILFLHKVLGFSLVQGTKILGFSSIFLTTVGIYIFTWLKTKSQTAAFLAGIFYLLSDVIWRWLFDFGLYAQSVSFMFVPLLLIFFDRFLDAYKNREERKKRVFLFLTALTYAILIFAHIVSGTIMAIVLPLYALFYFQLEKWDRPRLLRLWDGIRTSVLAGSLGLFLLAFWIFPYIRYFQEAGRDKVTLPGAHQIPYFTIPHFFGFFSNLADYEMWLVTTWVGVGILFSIGLIIAVFKNRSLLAWGLVALLFFLVMISPSINFVFMKIFYQYFAGIGVRGALVTSILFPVLGGFGAVALPRIILSTPAWVLGKLGLRLGSITTFLAKQAGNMIVSLVAIGIGLATVYFFRIPGNIKGCGEELYIGLGPSSDTSYCQFIQGFLKGKEEYPSFSLPREGRPEEDDLPPFSLTNEGVEDDKKEAAFVSRVDPGIDFRVDISPSLGSLMQRWNIYTETSQISLYAYGLSLIRAMWGYQQGLFYGPEPSNPGQIAEAAKWFGIQRVFLKDAVADNFENFPEEYWAKVYEEKPGELSVFELKEKVNLAEVSSRPTILVIAEHNFRAYEQIFKLANQGAFPYDDFYLVEGESRSVDDYSTEELSRFDGLILHSYDFQNRKEGEQKLTNYVKNGGRLWIETGWQYTSPDWERKETAPYIPLKSQNWVDLGPVSDYLLNKDIVKEIDERLFAPLEWEKRGWGFSSAKNSLKSWATTILSVPDYPLIAVGQYGQGRVVWSGMNLFSHVYDKENKEELKLIGVLGSWLFQDITSQNGIVTYIRNNPDGVDFTLDTPGEWLLWKEAYTPYWQAEAKTTNNKMQSLSFYRAGPGWVLIYIPKEYRQEGMVVKLRYVQSWAGYLGYAVTSFTFLGFLFYLTGLERRFFKKREVIPTEKISQKIKSWWEQDEE